MVSINTRCRRFTTLFSKHLIHRIWLHWSWLLVTLIEVINWYRTNVCLQCTKRQEKVKQTKWKIYSFICSKGCCCRPPGCNRSLWQLLKKIFREKPIKRAALSVSKMSEIQTAYARIYSPLSLSKSRGLWKVNREHVAGRAPGEIVGRERKREGVRETAMHAEQSKIIQCAQRDGKSFRTPGRRRLSL